MRWAEWGCKVLICQELKTEISFLHSGGSTLYGPVQSNSSFLWIKNPKISFYRVPVIRKRGRIQTKDKNSFFSPPRMETIFMLKSRKEVRRFPGQHLKMLILLIRLVKRERIYENGHNQTDNQHFLSLIPPGPVLKQRTLPYSIQIFSAPKYY